MKTKLIIAAVAALSATAVFAGGKMKAADTNGDGYVSQAEFTSAHTAKVNERFAKMDTDADGMLSEAEMMAAHEARKAQRHARKKGKRGRKMNPEKMVERFDTDGSGSLSLTELEGKRFSPDANSFAAADVNGSGELEAGEIQAMFEARRAEKRAARDAQDNGNL